jgi:hypothetical protein
MKRQMNKKPDNKKSTSKFGDIYVGDQKSHPGILKAKADKAKRDSVASAYKKIADTKKIAKDKPLVSYLIKKAKGK